MVQNAKGRVYSGSSFGSAESVLTTTPDQFCDKYMSRLPSLSYGRAYLRYLVRIGSR